MYGYEQVVEVSQGAFHPAGGHLPEENYQGGLGFWHYGYEFCFGSSEMVPLVM